MLKEIIKSNPTLFTLWFYLYRKNRGVKIDFFTKETILCIDGYPRSGNTFCLFLIRKLWPDLKIVHHLHAIAAIKIAKQKNIPVFCLVRDPMNTLSSWHLKSHVLKNKALSIEKLDIAHLTALTNNYIVYNNFILKELLSSEIILFNDLIEHPTKIMLLINDTAIPREAKYDYNTLSFKVNKIKNQSFGAKDKMGSSLPNTEKEKAKEKIQGYLKNAENYKQADRIYQQILEKKAKVL